MAKKQHPNKLISKIGEKVSPYNGALEGRVNGRFAKGNLWHLIRVNHGNTKLLDSPEHLAFKAKEYFDFCDKERKSKYNHAHLLLWLGISRKVYCDYKKLKDYGAVIDMIELFLEGETEDKLMWAGSTEGAKFKLKNKFGWVDEVSQNHNVTTIIAKFGEVIDDQPHTEVDDTKGIEE